MERRLFYAAVATLLAIPLVIGPVAGFGGLGAMARLLGVEGVIVVPTSLRSDLRAICFLFFAFAPLVAWSLVDLPGRAGAFRIVLACGFVSGLARLTGYFAEGYPGVAPTAFLGAELIGMPILLAWHWRLVRGAERATSAPRIRS